MSNDSLFPNTIRDVRSLICSLYIPTNAFSHRTLQEAILCRLYSMKKYMFKINLNSCILNKQECFDESILTEKSCSIPIFPDKCLMSGLLCSGYWTSWIQRYQFLSPKLQHKCTLFDQIISDSFLEYMIFVRCNLYKIQIKESRFSCAWKFFLLYTKLSNILLNLLD